MLAEVDGKAELVCVRWGGAEGWEWIKSSFCFMTTNGRVRKWLFLAGNASTPSPVRLELSSGWQRNTAPYWPTAASHVRLSAAWSTDHSSYHDHRLHVFWPSVEALASALVPVAVNYQADDDEENTTQHGEEHGEENGDSTHPFFSLTHWKTGGQAESQSEQEEGRDDSESDKRWRKEWHVTVWASCNSR